MPKKTWIKKLPWKKTNEIRNYLVEEINRNKFISKKHRKVCRILKYSLIVISTIIGCISISDFAFLVVISIAITRPKFGLNICAITTGIKKYKSINKKNKN